MPEDKRYIYYEFKEGIMSEPVTCDDKPDGKNEGDWLTDRKEKRDYRWINRDGKLQWIEFIHSEPIAVLQDKVADLTSALLFLLKDHVVIYVRRLQLDENDAFAKDELSKINDLIAALEKR